MHNLFQWPKDDPVQALRARHMLMAFASYLAIIIFLLYCSHIGLSRLSSMRTAQLVAFALGINLLFYMTICSGWNKRLRDPGMTLVQIIVSLLWLMIVLYFTDQIRGALLTMFLNILIFGILRLRTAQFLGVALFALAGYATVIALLEIEDPQAIDLQVEILQWVLLAMVLPWFAVIGAYISNIRSALRQKNKDMEKVLATIERVASHDELTGTYSRRFFLDALRREKARSDREHRTFCLAMLDLDLFKNVNDRHGHPAGDEVLHAFAECVQIELRGSDYLARYGGEEFALLLIDTDLEYAGGILERIRRRVEQCSFPHVGSAITVSAGVAEYQLDENPAETIGRADRALYAAKYAGRNRVERAAA
ncbi:MAG: diguanylate cyclase [Herminiimonas sp.]|nr:diguanylate cyclase [Herminiimonas sp.]